MNSKTYRVVVGICVAIVIFGSLFIIAQLRTGKSATPKPTPTPATFASQTDGEFTMTIQGPIVANEIFHTTTISISANNRSMTAFLTYDNIVTANNSFANNSEAYAQFASAMQDMGYGKTTKSTTKEVGSTCPTGKRYTYTFTGGGQTTVNSWSTTCNTKDQTMAGRISDIQNLFKAQIPNISRVPGYSEFPF